MKAHGTPLAGLVLVETTPKQDVRGQFTRVFCETEYTTLRSGLHWTQINLSVTDQKGTVRGMHFQHPPAAEAKLIRCLKGCIFDVAVDLRTGSPTFLHWHGVELCGDGLMQYFIPEGFAHGFQTLTEEVHILYLHNNNWDPERESGIRHDDPALAINWPLPVTQISEKDRNFPLLTKQFVGIQS